MESVKRTKLDWGWSLTSSGWSSSTHFGHNSSSFEDPFHRLAHWDFSLLNPDLPSSKNVPLNAGSSNYHNNYGIVENVNVNYEFHALAKGHADNEVTCFASLSDALVCGHSNGKVSVWKIKPTTHSETDGCHHNNKLHKHNRQKIYLPMDTDDSHTHSDTLFNYGSSTKQSSSKNQSNSTVLDSDHEPRHSFNKVLEFTAHLETVRCILIWNTEDEPSIPIVVTGSYDGSIRFWSRSGQWIHEIAQAHAQWIPTLCRFNHYLVSAGGIDKLIKIWKIQTRFENHHCLLQVTSEFHKQLKGHTDGVYALLYWGKHGQLWSGSTDSTVRVWSSPQTLNTQAFALDLPESLELQGHTAPVLSLAEWRGHIVSGSMDSSIRIWNFLGQCVKKFEVPSVKINSLTVWNGCLVSGGAPLATATVGDTAVRIWNWEGLSVSVECHGDSQSHKNSSSCKKSANAVCVWRNLICSCLDKKVIYLWKGSWPWNVERILWAGLMKNSPQECPLAKLNKELLHKIVHHLNCTPPFEMELPNKKRKR